MKKEAVVIVTILLILVAFSGCEEKNSVVNEPLVLVPLIDLILKTDDLPDGYVIENTHNLTFYEQFIGFYGNNTPYEVLEIVFQKENAIDNLEDISIILEKYNLTDNASSQYNSKMILFSLSTNEEVDESVNVLGDESIAFYVDLGNYIGVYLFFRIANIFCEMHIVDNYSLLYNLAKIVEERIYNSMN